ncbi:MAG TPA: 4Fe-4S binding protein [Candidatus Bathyarchaeia archaeon]|nr:4Fe-4S binding protein [Candidatus Bathyarchaeia archaeon]
MSKEREPQKDMKPRADEARTPGLRKRLLRFQTARVIVQLFLFFLFNAVFLGLGPWPILLPVTGLLGVPTKTMGDAFGALQYMLYLLIPPWLAIASIFVASVLVGRAFCAWACPFGLVQDILEVMKRRHTTVSPRTHSQMVNVKYFVLIATLLVSGLLTLSIVGGLGRGYQDALGVFAMAPFNALSPADTLFAVIPRTVLDVRHTLPLFFEPSADAAGLIANSISSSQALFWARLVVLGLTLALAVYVPRGWCRYFCPQGALSAILMRFSFLGLKRDPVRCGKDCRDCVKACPMVVPILDEPWEKFTHPECIMCLKCVDACSTAAIRPKFP